MKNKVIDFITSKEIIEVLGQSLATTAMYNKQAREGTIKGAFKFSSTWAFPIEYLKEKARKKGIRYDGVQLEDNEKGVSLLDYKTVLEWSEEKGYNMATIHSRIKRGTFKGDYVKFGNTYGIRNMEGKILKIK